MESLPVLPLYIGFVIVLTLASMLLGKWLFIFYALYIDPTSFMSDYTSDTPEDAHDKRIKSAGDSGRSAGTLTTTLVAVIYFVRTMWCRT